ncbi:hypothetical protein MHU86_21795 [Fragilaria crotonensis]|nr:hypothetical protein MHU86_21795 [Fragilaria crotonensis]
MAPPTPPTPPPPAPQQPKEVRKSPRTLKKEELERRKARYEQAALEYEAHEKLVAARKKLNKKAGPKKTVGKKTGKKRVNATHKRKRNPPPGKPNKNRAKNVEFDLLDDGGGDNDNDNNNDNDNDDNDNDNDNDNGNDNGNGSWNNYDNGNDNGNDDDDDDDDVGGKNDGNDDHDGVKIVGKRKVDDDDDDDESYHDDGEDMDLDEPLEGVVDDDLDSDDDQDSVSTSGQHGENEMQRRDGERRGVSTSTGHTASAVQPIPVVRTPTPADSSLLNIDGLLHIRGMSRSESLKCRQKFVTQRVNTFVKATLFRKIKFINTDNSFQRAMKLVMDHEDVPPQHRLNFQRTYESVFNEALNSKRSACEQSGGRIARKTIAEFETSGEAFFTMDEVSKLRRANTDRERKAFFWFFGTFLECVSGKRHWGGKKYLELVSKAKDKDGGGRNNVVTKSDEAFALLIFENYVDKWILQVQGTVPVNAANAGGKPRMKGKYTGKSSGHCKYGGWSPEGIVRFNELKKLVEEDRVCPQAETMEKELLEFSRSQQKGGGRGGNTQGEQGNNAARPEAMESFLVEAAWDSDE